VKSLQGDKAVVSVPAWGTELLGFRTAQMGVGDDVALSIRPEKIQLSESPEAPENCFEAVVTTSTYIGSDTHIYLDVRGQRIKVWEQNRTSRVDPGAYYRAGQKVWITLAPENTLVLSNA
jgi:ABC-type Fe3+/spermidine/putrescine transport system ATPase subunit